MRGTGKAAREQSLNALVLIEPDSNILDALSRLLQGLGWVVESSRGLDDLGQELEKQEVTAVISEASVPGCEPVEILNRCARHHVPVIFTGHDVSPQGAADLMQKGAMDFLEKPFSQTRLLDLLNRLRNRHNEQVGNP